MTEYIGHAVQRWEEWEKLTLAATPVWKNALEQVDAAVWLIAGQRYTQALSSLHAGIELMLKADLEAAHPLYVVERINFRQLKQLVSNASAQQPLPNAGGSTTFDIDKTVNFNESFKRVKDLRPQLAPWGPKLEELNKTRNAIMHRGHATAADLDHYIELICLSAFPFVQAFVRLATSIDLEKLFGPAVSREINVAIEVCDSAKKRRASNLSYAFQTLTTALLYRNVQFPVPTNRRGYPDEDWEREFRISDSVLLDFAAHWQNDIISVSCKICDSALAHAGVEGFDDENPVDLAPTMIVCPQCGLWIGATHSDLARIHFDLIPAQWIAKNRVDADSASWRLKS